MQKTMTFEQDETNEKSEERVGLPGCGVLGLGTTLF